MMSRKSSAVVGAAFLTVALAVPTMAQEPTVEVLADGLNNPRGVKVADDGSIYVAEAGFGGDTCLGEGAEAMCYGPTGSVVRVTPDGVERVVEVLNSGASGPEAGGASDTAIAADGTLYVVINLGADPASRADMPEAFANAGPTQRWVVRSTPTPTASWPRTVASRSLMRAAMTCCSWAMMAASRSWV